MHYSPTTNTRALSVAMIRILQTTVRKIEQVAPLFPVASGMTLGIVVDGLFAPPQAVYIAGFVFAAALCLSRGIRRSAGPIVLLVAAFCVGGAYHCDRARIISPSSIERHIEPERRLARLRGHIASEPRVLAPSEFAFTRWTYGSERTVFLVDVESIEGMNGAVLSSGRLRVTVGEAVLDLREGEAVELFGWLYGHRAANNPGGFDWAKHYRRQGIVGAMHCKHMESVTRLASDGRATTGSLLAHIRSRMRGFLTDDLAGGSHEEASLLAAMVLGHRSGLDRRLNDVFIDAGCIHFLAVSGVHVVIVMFIVRALCAVAMLRRRTCILAMIVAVILYALITEPRPPIMRASIIALTYLVACLMGRERACLNWISATAIVLALIDPTMIFDVGYQLSSAAVLGVSYVAPALARAATVIRRRVLWLWYGRGSRLRGTPLDVILADFDQIAMRYMPPRGIRVRRWLGSALAIALGAWLAGWPIVATYFHRVQPWGPLNSVIVLPLVGLVMALGFAKLGATVVSPTLGLGVAAVLGWGDWLLIGLVERMAKLPGAAIDLSAPPWWLMVAYYLFLCALIWRFQPPLHDEQEKEAAAAPAPAVAEPPVLSRRASAAFFAVCSVCLVLSFGGWFMAKRSDGRLTLHVLAVGSGSAVVIELPDERVVIYDAGAGAPYDVGRHTVVPFLRARGIDRVERVFLSHPNLDHYGGVPTLIDAMTVGAIVINENFVELGSSSASCRHLLDILDREGVRVETLDPTDRAWEMGGVTFELLWPPPADALPGDQPLTANSTSTVLRLTYKGRRVLLTGDIEDIPQRWLTQRGGIKADVLVLPHHGGVRRSTAAFIEAVGAEILVRSSGQRMSETRSALPALTKDALLFNTADIGAVRIVLDATGASAFGFLPADKPDNFARK